jgi:GDPmannose 4,6-dehydratase
LGEVGRVSSTDPAVADENLAVKPGDVVVRVDQRYYRPAEVESLLGDPALARDQLGWQPTTTLDEMISEMVAHDLTDARKNRLLQREGYEVSHARE